MIFPIRTYTLMIVKYGVCMSNQILRRGTAHKSKRHTSNFANVFRGKQQGF